MNIMTIKKRSRLGFTLVELIVVIAILAILAGVAIPVYSGYIKKANEAADLQLLEATNAAFAAACLENGLDSKFVVAAKLLQVDDNEKKIGGVEILGVDTRYVKLGASGVSDGFAMLGAHTAQLTSLSDLSDKVNTAFRTRYFKGNENAEFKFYESVDAIVFSGGAFTAAKMTLTQTTYTAEQVEALVETYQQSSFSEMQPIELAETVDTLADALGNKDFANIFGTLASIGADSYSEFLNGLGLVTNPSDAGFDATALANATALYVAEVASQTDAATMTGRIQATLNHLGDPSTGILGEDGKVIPGTSSTTILTALMQSGEDPIVMAAMLYGMSTAYLASGQASESAMAYDAPVTGLTSLVNFVANAATDNTEKVNLGTEDEPNMQGRFNSYMFYTGTGATDISGYMSALQLVDAYTEDGSLDLSQSSLFESPEIMAILYQLLGSTSNP